MNGFLRLGAYVLHPLWMPLVGAVLYYNISPRYREVDMVQMKLLAIAIVTLFIPIIVYFLLRNLGVVASIHLQDVRERRYPLMIECLLVILLLKTIFYEFESPELYYFFVGILFSALSALILVFFKIKASLHQMGIAGVTMFLLALSIHFQVNMLIWIGLFLFFNGWVASSRIHTNAHSQKEVALGFLIGVIPQLIVLNYWL